MNGRKPKANKDKKQNKPVYLTPTVLKTAFKKTAVLVMSTALITHPIDLPYIHAYFTDKIISSASGVRNNTLGLRALEVLERGAVELAFDIHRFTDLDIDVEVRFVKGLLLVEMTLPEGFGFTAGDILQNSLKLAYDGEIIEIAPTDIEINGNDIKVTYDWNEVEKVLDIDDNSPRFELSGKGAGWGESGLGERFIFRGQGKIADLDWEFFDQMEYSYHIRGPRQLLVPTPEEGSQSYIFEFFIDNKRVSDDEVEWSLRPQVPGVRFQSGELVVDSSAPAAHMVIAAQLKSNRYFACELDVELLEPEIQGVIGVHEGVLGEGQPGPSQEGETLFGGTGESERGGSNPAEKPDGDGAGGDDADGDADRGDKGDGIDEGEDKDGTGKDSPGDGTPIDPNDDGDGDGEDEDEDKSGTGEGETPPPDGDGDSGDDDTDDGTSAIGDGTSPQDTDDADEKIGSYKDDADKDKKDQAFTNEGDYEPDEGPGDYHTVDIDDDAPQDTQQQNKDPVDADGEDIDFYDTS